MEQRVRIIFVDDEPCVLSGLQRMLFDREDEWEMQFVASGKEALQAFEQQAFDVIVSDMRMPEMDGSQLLMAVQEHWPESVRIILSGQAEKEAVLRWIGPSHRFLPKPCESRKLHETIDNACQLHQAIRKSQSTNTASNRFSIPCMPGLYDLLINKMRSPEPSPERLASLLAAQSELSRNLMLIVNSASQDRSHQFCDLLEIVRAIGVDRLRPLVLTAGIFANYSDSVYLQDTNQQFINHSATVSRLAQAITEREMPGDSEAIGAAMLGGLVHDVGKLISDQHPSDHAALGAYLLSLWGIPDGIVEVVAYHHEPRLSRDKRFSPLTAVHVANELEVAHRTGNAEKLDFEYLSRVGVASKLDRWRSLMPTNRNSWFYPAMIEGSRSDLALSSSLLLKA